MAASGSHSNIVRYYSSWTEQQSEGQYFYILMEKCDVSLGTKHLLDGQAFREDELLDILRQVWQASALHHYMPSWRAFSHVVQCLFPGKGSKTLTLSDQPFDPLQFRCQFWKALEKLHLLDLRKIIISDSRAFKMSSTQNLAEYCCPLGV